MRLPLRLRRTTPPNTPDLFSAKTVQASSSFAASSQTDEPRVAVVGISCEYMPASGSGSADAEISGEIMSLRSKTSGFAIVVCAVALVAALICVQHRRSATSSVSEPSVTEYRDWFGPGIYVVQDPSGDWAYLVLDENDHARNLILALTELGLTDSTGNNTYPKLPSSTFSEKQLHVQLDPWVTIFVSTESAHLVQLVDIYGIHDRHTTLQRDTLAHRVRGLKKERKTVQTLLKSLASTSNTNET